MIAARGSAVRHPLPSAHWFRNSDEVMAIRPAARSEIMTDERNREHAGAEASSDGVAGYDERKERRRGRLTTR
ncbi:hypothetical protein BRAS3809_1470007 [Bradyrhizobium sp. STM 3809]|nr:hypothetical protein BRAS3809_1470007 [Bradyrhizobium sp. STM 3809]